MHHCRVLIVGAGPAGSTASLFLSGLRIPHLLIDKAVFPRDKICGDALSGKVFSVLKKLDASLVEQLRTHPSFTGSHGVSFFSPSGIRLDLPFSSVPGPAPGGVLSRLDFDDWLFSCTRSDYADVRHEHRLLQVQRKDDHWLCELQTPQGKINITCDLLLGAEGDRSLVSKQLKAKKIDPSAYSAGLRMYWEGVSDMHPSGNIELHFLKDLLPGYFWIFPMANGRCNTGLGMLSKDVSEKNIDLKKVMMDIIREHPAMAHRFKNARPLENPRGWGLPLGAKQQALSGEAFLLLGDAGSLIDPFTGEGIANAMISGMHAAQVAAEAIAQNNFSASFLKNYDHRVYARLWKELATGKRLQQLSRYPALFDFVVKKAANNESLRNLLSAMFNDLDLRKQLKSPSFYLKLLFR